jgi:hypothetical protein
LGWGLLYKGQTAQGAGWLGRAQRLVDDLGDDFEERGSLLIPVALRQMGGGDAE